jgi:hypothetical protein
MYYMLVGWSNLVDKHLCLHRTKIKEELRNESRCVPMADVLIRNIFNMCNNYLSIKL